MAAGLNYKVLRADVQFDNGREMARGEGSVLFRNDTGSMLSVVSDRYKIVQPEEVVDFYRDLTAHHGFTMETMGALSDGKRVWALAKVGEGFTVGKNDRIENYLLLATSYDKSMATRAQFTTVRVVCHNTLSMAVASKNSCVSISHSAMFDGNKVKLDMGIITDGNKAMQEAFTAMADRKVARRDALNWIAKVMFDIESQEELEKVSTKKSNIIQGVS